MKRAKIFATDLLNISSRYEVKVLSVDKINITGITFWGTHDSVSWLQEAALVGGGSDGNRPQMPLPFDDACNEKPAFWGIIDA